MKNTITNLSEAINGLRERGLISERLSQFSILINLMEEDLNEYLNQLNRGNVKRALDGVSSVNHELCAIRKLYDKYNYYGPFLDLVLKIYSEKLTETRGYIPGDPL